MTETKFTPGSDQELEYWQMREVLGFPIPNWVDEKWPRQFQGNGGVNPFRCGLCEARRLNPELHLRVEVFHRIRNGIEKIFGPDLTEAETELLCHDLDGLQ